MTNKITDVPNEYKGKIGIELRGSTSQSFPKKPYGFETWDESGEDNDVKLLGMPKESDWTLNATYNDKTLMRDGLCYILAGSVMEYAPRVRYNELVINGQYRGIYLLVEKIKRDKNRVDIAKMETTDNQGDALPVDISLRLTKNQVVTVVRVGILFIHHIPEHVKRHIFSMSIPKQMIAVMNSEIISEII